MTENVFILPVYVKDMPPEYDTYSASRNVDVLTHNRINTLGGFRNLSPYQQAIVETVTKNIAIFNYENADFLNSFGGSYSINGVSMSSSGTLPASSVNIQGVILPNSDYQLLLSTGLCSCIL